MAKPQRIRDPIHNLIEFDGDKFEQMCWAIIETREFQRLRRIKQLGFSELVYPSACHSRFAHSIGVFHTARQLGKVLHKIIGEAHDNIKSKAAIAAALVHDLGHGPFSHAFEDVLQRLGQTKHEATSVRIIKETQIRKHLEDFQPGFTNHVAKVISNKIPADIYASIANSQFDADRLDYMRRDRFMTGAQSSAIDFEWLLANLEVRRVPLGQDEAEIGEVDTLVVGHKALLAVEAYVLGLFHLYPNVYYHKSTRSAEKMCSELLFRLFTLIREGKSEDLSASHPLTRFATKPEEIENFIELDDSLVWGTLPILEESKDSCVAELSKRLLQRKLYKAIDVTAKVEAFCADIHDSNERDQTQLRCLASIRASVEESGLLGSNGGAPRALSDSVDRDPYRKNQGDEAALDKMYAIDRAGTLRELPVISRVVAGLTSFVAYRLYYREDDVEVKEKLSALIQQGLKK